MSTYFYQTRYFFLLNLINNGNIFTNPRKGRLNMGIEYIKERKKELNMTTEELSKKSGVPIGTLNKILAGQTTDPKFETLKAICNALNISLTDIANHEKYDTIYTTPFPHDSDESTDEKLDKTDVILLMENHSKLLAEHSQRERLEIYAEKLALLLNYDKVNTLGKEMIIEHSNYIANNPKYTNKDND